MTTVIEFSKFMVIARRANSANLFRPKLSVTLGLLPLDSIPFIKVFVAMFNRFTTQASFRFII